MICSVFGVRKLESLGYLMMSSVVSTQHTSVTDRRTDTARQNVPRYVFIRSYSFRQVDKTQLQKVKVKPGT